MTGRGSNTKPEPEYSDRYVAFLDILGFRDLISRSIGPEAAAPVRQIRTILDLPGPAEECKVILGRIGDISHSDHLSTAFSDSIVISTDPTEQGLIHLLMHVEKIGFSLLRLEMLYRGGIARGLLYHDERSVFGPGLIAAYDLEDRERLPRVVLDQPVVDAARSTDEPVRTIFKRTTREDTDGVTFVHYLRVLRQIADCEGQTPSDVRELQEGTRSFIDRALTRFQEDRGKVKKYEWFRDYFSWATDESWKDILDAPFPG